MSTPTALPPTPLPPREPSTGRRTIGRRLSAAAIHVQRRIATALGASAQRRTEVVVTMLRDNARQAPGYWIQLILATGIATLGLVLGSTAVVIGGMLVSPLMGPILELGMGFAIGSALLVYRAAFRVLLSVAAVVATAALIVVVLPFHEITPEITARDAPTAIDLLVAVFCALTAAYTTVRATSETTSAAAGTAIGIALVPPLCVAGFGIATAAPAVTGGAVLLFTANFSAIILFSVGPFLLLGYHQVDAVQLEHEHLEEGGEMRDRMAVRIHRALGSLFGSRYGLAMRLLFPVLFFAVVAVPLSAALDEVSWEVHTRAALKRILATSARTAVQTRVRVDGRDVALQLLIVGSSDDAARLERTLERRVSAETGAESPEVTVTAVADARALAAATARARRADDGVPPAALSAMATPAAMRGRIDSVLAARWPAAAAGPIAGWAASFPDGGPVAVTVHYIGRTIGPAADSLLAGALTESGGGPMRVTCVPIPPDTIVSRPGAERAWLDSARVALRAAEPASRVVAFVGEPGPAGGASARRRGAAMRAALDSTGMARAGRVVFVAAPRWSLHFRVATPPRHATSE